MITTNLGDCFEIKDGVLRVNRGLYETLEKEGIVFRGTPEELKPLEDALQSYFKEDTPADANRVIYMSEYKGPMTFTPCKRNLRGRRL